MKKFPAILSSVLIGTCLIFPVGMNQNIVPVQAVSTYSYTVGNSSYEYTMTNGKVSITKYKGRDTVIVIPATINGAKVTTIGTSAFENASKITSVTIAPEITSIQDGAFLGCTSLKEVSLPSTLISIGSGAFSGCTSLTSLVIPDSVKNIGDWAFSESGLTSVTIPEGVTTIDDGLFYKCTSLTTAKISSATTHIGDGAFYNCSNLTSVNVPASVTYIGNNAFKGCTKFAFSNMNVSITAPATTVAENTCVDMKVSISGGNGGYKYTFIITNNDTGKSATLAKDQLSNHYSWYSSGAGSKTLKVIVTDKNKSTASASIDMRVVRQSTPIASLSAPYTGSPVATNVRLTARASGGSGNYKYRFRITNNTTGKSGILRDYNSSATFDWNTGSTLGNKTIYVDVKDSKGNVGTSSMNFTVTESLRGSISMVSTELVTGSTNKVSINAYGGLSGYSYRFRVYNESSEQSLTLRDYSTSATYNWNVGSKTGYKILYVDIKDSNGFVKTISQRVHVK